MTEPAQTTPEETTPDETMPEDWPRLTRPTIIGLAAIMVIFAPLLFVVPTCYNQIFRLSRPMLQPRNNFTTESVTLGIVVYAVCVLFSFGFLTAMLKAGKAPGFVVGCFYTLLLGPILLSTFGWLIQGNLDGIVFVALYIICAIVLLGISIYIVSAGKKAVVPFYRHPTFFLSVLAVTAPAFVIIEALQHPLYPWFDRLDRALLFLAAAAAGLPVSCLGIIWLWVARLRRGSVLPIAILYALLFAVVLFYPKLRLPGYLYFHETAYKETIERHRDKIEPGELLVVKDENGEMDYLISSGPPFLAVFVYEDSGKWSWRGFVYDPSGEIDRLYDKYVEDRIDPEIFESNPRDMEKVKDGWYLINFHYATKGHQPGSD